MVDGVTDTLDQQAYGQRDLLVTTRVTYWPLNFASHLSFIPLAPPLSSGYFCVDPDSTPGKLVFNRTVTLRESYPKFGAK